MSEHLRADGLTKIYDRSLGRGRQTALADCTFAVAAGETFGLAGANGAGKTTTLKLVLGLIHPTAGSVTIHGRPAGEPAARLGLGYVPELPAVHPFLSGRESLAQAARLAGIGAADRPARIAESLAFVGLDSAAQRRTSGYSKGMRVRLCLARALLANPSLLVLDEPTTGLDPIAVRQVAKILADLKSRGVTILLSSHDLRTMHAACDRVAVLMAGRLVAARPVTEWPDRDRFEAAVCELIGEESR